MNFNLTVSPCRDEGRHFTYIYQLNLTNYEVDILIPILHVRKQVQRI